MVNICVSTTNAARLERRPTWISEGWQIPALLNEPNSRCATIGNVSANQTTTAAHVPARRQHWKLVWSSVPPDATTTISAAYGQHGKCQYASTTGLSSTCNVGTCSHAKPVSEYGSNPSYRSDETSTTCNASPLGSP